MESDPIFPSDVAADTVRILEAVDALVSRHAESITTVAPRFAYVDPHADECAVPLGEHTALASAPRTFAKLHPHSSLQGMSCSVGVMCAGPLMKAIGLQYGDDCGWGTRAVGTNTGDVVSLTVPDMQPSLTRSSSLGSVAKGIQTEGMRVQHTSTDPVDTRTTGTLTEIWGGDIVVANFLQRELMELQRASCDMLELAVGRQLSLVSQRVEHVGVSVGTLHCFVNRQQQIVDRLLAKTRSLEQENEALRQELHVVHEDAEVRDRELATWRSLSEEMAQSSETTSAENDRLRQQVSFLEGMVQRFERAMSNPAPRDVHCTVDREAHHSDKESDSTGTPRGRSTEERDVISTRLPVTPGAFPTVKPPRSQRPQQDVLSAHDQPIRLPRVPITETSPHRHEAPRANAGTSPLQPDVWRHLYDQCSAALSLAEESDED